MSAFDWDLQHHQHQEQQHQQDQHQHQHLEQQQQQQQCFTVTEPLHSETKGSKRSRQTYSKYQTAVLETVFRTSKYIVRSKRQQMSVELDLTERQIKIWFQNRRMKEKKCHKDVPRIDNSGCSSTTGYADDYSVEETCTAGYPVVPINNNLRDDPFASYRGPVSKQHCGNDDSGSGYAGYGIGGYELQLTPEPDPYATAKLQQWPPVTSVDFHQDYYGDHDLSHFQRLQQTTHHHRGPLNSQVPDYCSPPQLLQAANGY